MGKRKIVAASDSDGDDDYPQTRPSSSKLAKNTRTTKSRQSTRAQINDVEDDGHSSEDVELSKKQKSAVSDDESGDVAVKVNEVGEKYIDLGKKRRATVRSFKGTVFLDIREYYGDESDPKPGKKGITLTKEQWEVMKKGADTIDVLFAKMK